MTVELSPELEARFKEWGRDTLEKDDVLVVLVLSIGHRSKVYK